MHTFFLAQVIGIINLIPLIFCIQQRDKGRLLVWSLVLNFLFAVQFLLLGAYVGMIMALISLLRCLVFYFYQVKNHPPSPLTLILILVLTIGAGGWFWQNIYSLLSILGSALSTYAMWQNNMKTLRLTNLVSTSCTFAYALITGAFTGSLVEFVGLSSNLIAIWRHDWRKKTRSRSKKY